MRELEEAHESGRRQVLDDLAGEDGAEACVFERLEVREQVGLLDVEALTACEGDHVRVAVDAARLDARVAQEREQLAPPAADVEHGRAVAERRRRTGR